MPSLRFKPKKRGQPKTANPFAIAGRDERIRTSGPLNPIQVRYQTALHPDKIITNQQVAPI